MSLVYALTLGAIVGAIFALANLVPPAPATWAGIAGIAGILAGWQFVGWLR